MVAPNQLTTAYQLLTYPDDDQRHELIAGRVVSQPPASFRHGATASRLHRLLVDFVSESDGFVMSSETGFLLRSDPDTVRAPDLAFVSTRRIETAGRFDGFFPGPPDLAIEVLSPSERPSQVRAKVRDYLSAGTDVVWVIDPSRYQVRVHRRAARSVVLDADAFLDGGELLPGFRVPVAALFPV